MRFPPEFLDEIRTRLPVSQVVGRRVRLQRRGREHVGLSPFNKEKTPSFTVNDDKGFYHCFSSGEHGDIFAFLMKTEGLDFAEAVERLAGEAGLALPERSAADHAEHRRQAGFRDAVEAACRFFEEQLWLPAGARALGYLRGRGLADAAIKGFRLGYAPADRRALLRGLEGVGIAADLAVDAGIARRPDDGGAPYSFFRNRIMFPVGDLRDRVVGFGARLIDGDGPKYINSPDGPLFHKGSLLYSQLRARTAARAGSPVLVVEGYMDVIALVSAGFDGAVAPLGTAFTENQAEALWRFAETPTLCFDGDTAGQQAAGRAAERVLPLLRPDHTVRVALLPPGKDPDDLVRAGGASAVKAVLDRTLSLADVLWDLEVGRHRMDGPEGRAGLERALEAQARRISDPTVQSYYLREFRRRLSEAFPWRSGRPRADRGGHPWAPPKPGAVGLGPRPRGGGQVPSVEAVLLATVIRFPERFEAVAEPFATLSFDDSSLKRLHDQVCRDLSRQPDLDSVQLAAHVAEAGLQSAVDDLLQRLVDGPERQGDGLAQFLRPGAAPEAVETGWVTFWQRWEEARIARDREAAADSVRRDATESNWNRVRALQAQAENYRRSEGK